MMPHVPKMMLLPIVVIAMAMGSMGPAFADPAPLQAPTEVEMGTAMTDAADWMLTVVGTDGQLDPPPSAPSWERESAGRLSLNGLALLRAYQTTGDTRYLDRATAAGDLLVKSVEAGQSYVIARTGALPTEAGSGLPNVQPGKVDDTYVAGHTGTLRFDLWQALQCMWFLTGLYEETGTATYSDNVLLMDRLVFQQFFAGGDALNGLVSHITLDLDGNWSHGSVTSTTDHALALYVISVAETTAPNLNNKVFDLITYVRTQQNDDGSFKDRVSLPGQDSDSEIKHALMVPALYDLGRPKEARGLADWIKGRQKSDGSFDCPHDHDTPGDTFSATMNLLPVGEVTSGGDGLYWIIGRQETDGSWAPEPGLHIETTKMLNTQWAMLALFSGLTNYNLKLTDEHVDSTAVWEGDPAKVMAFTINITVVNEGLVQVIDAAVRLYDGPRVPGNPPHAEMSIDVPALGETNLQLELRPVARGPHDVHVWVTYATGGEFHGRDNNVSFLVNLNREPTGRIEAPTEGQLFGFGAEITFTAADIFDADGDLVNLTWTDDVVGLLSHEPNFTRILPPGDHRVVLTFADGNGPTTSANVSFSVRQNIPPTIRISVPAEGARYFDYQQITFDASASSDAEGHELSFTWESDRDGTLGHGAVISDRLSPGVHRITVWVDDSWDNGSRSVSIRVIETFPPVVAITSPVEGETYVTTTRVEFDASGTTDPDSEILEFFWYSNIDGRLSELPSFLAKLRVGQHRITLAVSDGNYNVSETITIEVLENRPPVSIISSPEHGSSYDSDQLIELNGSGSYDLEDPITYFWVSDREGVLGAAPVITTHLRRGEHTITLWVNDGYGHNISTSATVTVNNLGPTAGISSPEPGSTYPTGVPVRFTSDTSSDPEGDRLDHEWFYRRASGDWTPMGTQAMAERTFEEAGEYQVRLLVSDGKANDETSLVFNIRKAADGDGGDEGGDTMLYMATGVLIAVIVVGAVVYVLRKGREPY